MKKILLLFLLCTVSFNIAIAQNDDEKNIKDIQAVLKSQRIAWSKDNIEKYMEGYWKSDSLVFYGSNGIVQGWDNTLERYKKAYPTKEHTGKLNFRINAVTKIAEDAYYVLGEYHIKREVGNADGNFMLVFKKIKGEWKIIADMST
ncbi:DUF4440 domain-containing protein [Seonamhaeicola sp. ML3]|uniref:YybH family protein n=1 Tax=Seonamhaeicola sp. ML3 TaxID=2937786 RepID=UPI0020102132|nr:nuclear transport factor 2 family protein [Seonamhaeicola sp. ML3]